MNIVNLYIRQITSNIPKSHIEENLKLVVYAAKRFCRKYDCYDLMSDFIQAGNIGLMQACKKFDNSKGFKFSTYAMDWINANIILEVRKQYLIHLPDSQIKKGKEHTQVFSYNNLPEGESLLEYFHDDSHINIIKELFKKGLKKELENLINKVLIKEIENKIIRLRYLEECTLQEIGNTLGRSRQNTEQIEKRALRRLKSSKEIIELYKNYKEEI